ncbi:MAG: FecR domain-containing protein [Rhodothermales bacterium]
MRPTTIALSAALLLFAMASHTPVFAQEQGAVPFKVFRIKGSVNVVKPDGTWRKLKRTIPPGDDIETGEDGEASASGGSNPEIKCTFCPSTRATNTADNGVPSFKLKKGSAFCSVVSKAKRQGIIFKIKTDVGVTGVMGTAFLTSYDEQVEEMRASVTESNVLLSDVEDKSVVLGPNQEGIIQRWERASFEAVGTGTTEREARTAAAESMLELLHGVVITGTTQVRDLVAGKDRMTRQLNAFINRVASVTFDQPSRGSVEARMTLDPQAVKDELGKMAGQPITDTYMLRAQTGFSADEDRLVQTFAPSLQSRSN